MTKKEFTDYLFKIMYELGYRKAEIIKEGVFFYKDNTLMSTWTPRVPIQCTCFVDKYQCIDIGEYLDIVDWDKVKIDTRVLVSDDGVNWHKRHFARYTCGRVYAWGYGSTSWSKGNASDVAPWRYAKLAGDMA